MVLLCSFVQTVGVSVSILGIYRY